MSIFQAREWWSAEPENDGATGVDAEAGAFCCVTLASFPATLGHPAQTIITGSLSGLLRIVLPFRAEPEEEAEKREVANILPSKTYEAGNLLLEQQMKLPLLSIKTGRLAASGGSDPKIAVLHPRRLSVYSLALNRGKTRESDSFSLTTHYHFELSRSAFSLTIGPFGAGASTAKKDFLCVQSIDGTLNFFEQESYAFSRFLPGFLLPGPVIYVERTDSLVTASSAYQLESYRYQLLAVAGVEATGDGSNDKPKTDHIVTGRRVTADWNLGLGEACIDLQVINSDKRDTPSTIVALCSRSFCALLDTGIVTFIKKLDFCPLCALSYRSSTLASNPKIMTLVASPTQTLLIYQNTTLKWAAQMPFSPAYITRGTFKKTFLGDDLLKDMLVLSSAQGHLYASYLGTDPAIFSVPAIAREVNYEETDKEYAELTSHIKAAQSDGSFAPKSNNPELVVTCSVAPQFQRCIYETKFTGEDLERLGPDSTLSTATVLVQLRTNAPLSKVRVTIGAEEPLRVAHPTHVVNSLTDSFTVEAHVYLHSKFVPHSLDALVSVVYLNGRGVPNVLTFKVSLPLKIVLRPCPPIKDADYKVTLSTNKPAVSLLDLFPEFVLDSTMSNAAGFQYYCGPFVTVLSSKTSQRYRLQSDNLPSLWLLTSELERRLHKVHSHKKDAQSSSPLQCSYSSSLPMHEYFTEIEAHFVKRSRMKTMSDQLSQRATQFRSIERRLLSRFKDKTPTPLTNLDTLLEGTYRQIVAAADEVEQCESELNSSSCNLSCITNLLLMLSRLSTGMTDEEAHKLSAALSPIVQTSQEQGWEETTDAALTYLLRTSLAKPGKENQGATPITLTTPKDTTRLKKHISSVMDRVAKGGRIVDSKNQMPATSLLDFSELAGEGKSEEDSLVTFAEEVDRAGSEGPVPVGSQFGEAGERLRSARVRTARGQSTRPRTTSAPEGRSDGGSGEQQDDSDLDNFIQNEGGEDVDDDTEDLIGW